jgi:raffinose/stachyose/melibiose transport system permease protein
MPTVLSVVIIGFIWQLILNPLWGVSESMLKAIQLGSLFKPWLGLPSTALITVSLISVWQFVGIPMILFYTALIGIPEELTEAARVDGASGWDTFWNIKFPLILPTVGIVAILTFVGNFNAFDLIYTMKGANAGPAFATDIMGTLFFRTFYGQQLQLGNPTMGATVAAMTFLIILTGVLLYMFVWQRRVQTFEM